MVIRGSHLISVIYTDLYLLHDHKQNIYLLFDFYVHLLQKKKGMESKSIPFTVFGCLHDHL